MPSSTPRVSILIPNYNNGRASSRDGRRDFILDLLMSLDRTLADDPTPFEVLAFDDGSTDDSIDTLRDWAESRRWRDDRPFLRLMEAPHCGVLSITANKLSAAARGEFLVRLDGDIVCLTDQWVTRLCEAFDSAPPRLGVIGPKQLKVNERIHAFGDWLLHPNGYTHIGAEAHRHFVTRAMEVDHVMGCFYCCRKRVWEELGGYDEDFLRGQTIDFGLRARLAGWSTIAIPNIEYIHAHSERRPRSTTADTRDGIDQTRKTFYRKWGFDRLAPDLEVVRRLYSGTPLLWNSRWFGPQSCEDLMESDIAPTLEESPWGRYSNRPQFRQAADFRRAAAIDLIRQLKPGGPVVEFQCGAGLLGHLLATSGVPYIGVDRRVGHLRLANSATAAQQYPAAPPKFIHQADGERLPFDDQSVAMLLIVDELERHPNPVRLLREANRVLQPNGAVVVISQRKRPLEEAPTNATHRYLPNEILQQFMAVGGFSLAINPNDIGVHNDLLFVARRDGDCLKWDDLVDTDLESDPPRRVRVEQEAAMTAA
ncbi:MAG: methyltransferase domain-containing protein [Phycisphaerales bacterium]